MSGERASHGGVIIIGAGPAGCAVAIALRKAGVACTLLERRVPAAPHLDTPRESLHPGVRTLLQALGADSAWTGSVTGTYTAITRNGTCEPLSPLPAAVWSGAHVCRSVFDRLLQQCAVRAGAVLLRGRTVRNLLRSGEHVVGVRTHDGLEHHAAYVVDASGRQQLAARRMGWPARPASGPLIACTGRMPCSAHAANTAHFTSGPDGWCWEAVDSDGSATWTRVTTSPVQAREWGRAAGGTDSASSGMRWCLVRPVAAEGLLLAGDAASVLDPASGQGVFKALSDGLRAANTILDILYGHRPANIALAVYDQRTAQAFHERAEALGRAYAHLGIGLLHDTVQKP